MLDYNTFSRDTFLFVLRFCCFLISFLFHFSFTAVGSAAVGLQRVHDLLALVPASLFTFL